MKLLIINDHGLVGGGTENRIRVFVEQLVENKQVSEVHVLQRFAVQNQNILEKTFFHTILPGQSGYAVARKIIKKHKINIVQVHNLLSIGPYVIFAAWQAAIPVFWWVHDYWLLCANRSFINPYHASQEKLCQKAAMQNCHRCMGVKTRIKHVMWKNIMNLCQGAFAPSHIVKEIHEHEGVLRGKWSVVTPWIDPLFLANISVSKQEKTISLMKEKGEKILLFVGSLIEFKGAWVAARSLKYIVKKFPDIKLVFVGGDQEDKSRYRMDIMERADKEGVKEHILFLGKKQKEELVRTYRQADIFLCPTVCMESFGQTWAEAMACGVPVIASAVGSIPEYIKDKKTGLLFPPGDEMALALRILELLENPKNKRQIAQEGARYAQIQFNCQRAVEEISTLYNDALETPLVPSKNIYKSPSDSFEA